jgi:hypothetical protein
MVKLFSLHACRRFPLYAGRRDAVIYTNPVDIDLSFPSWPGYLSPHVLEEVAPTRRAMTIGGRVP